MSLRALAAAALLLSGCGLLERETDPSTVYAAGFETPIDAVEIKAWGPLQSTQGVVWLDIFSPTPPMVRDVDRWKPCDVAEVRRQLEATRGRALMVSRSARLECQCQDRDQPKSACLVRDIASGMTWYQAWDEG